MPDQYSHIEEFLERIAVAIEVANEINRECLEHIKAQKQVFLLDPIETAERRQEPIPEDPRLTALLDRMDRYERETLIGGWR